MTMIVKILEAPIGWMQKEIEQVSGFLWHYYLVLFLTIAMFSSVTTKIRASVQAEGDVVRASQVGSTQCLQQLNDITSKLSK